MRTLGWISAIAVAIAPLPAHAQRPAPEAPILRLATDFGSWRWRTGSQAVFASNVLNLVQGPTGMGANLNLRGTLQQYVPEAHGHLVGYIEQQSMRFVDPSFDHGRLATSFALNHAQLPKRPFLPTLHLFEGGTLFYRMADRYATANYLDADLFAGVGASGLLPFGGSWFSTLTIDRMMASVLRESYYGQTFRVGATRSMNGRFQLSLQGTAQRIDPMILSTPFLRCFVHCSAESEVRPGLSLGVQALAGAQQMRTGLGTFLHTGPYLQTRF